MWHNTKEAVRALNDSLPLIEGCQEAMVFSGDKQSGDAYRNLSKYLDCHGIKSSSIILEIGSDDVGIMDMLLNQVSNTGADLLVMGVSMSAVPWVRLVQELELATFSTI